VNLVAQESAARETKNPELSCRLTTPGDKELRTIKVSKE